MLFGSTVAFGVALLTSGTVKKRRATRIFARAGDLLRSTERIRTVPVRERAREELTPASPLAADKVRASSSGAALAPRPSGADGLLHIVASYLQCKNDNKNGNGTARGDAPAPSAQVVIHLDKDLGAGAGAMAASLDDGTHVSAETLRRVACDGGVVAAVVDEQAGVLDVGRRTRTIPTAIKRALWLRDQGCRFPGCANHRFVHGHHVQHWFHGGRTSLDNLLLLCSFHHRLVHEGGFTIAPAEGAKIEVRAPSGALLTAVPPLAPDLGAVECYGDWWASGDSFAPPLPLWDGGPVDYDEAIGSLAGA